MADFIKTENGLLFSDKFEESTLLWALSPNDYSKVDFADGLKIQHNENYTTYTIQEPYLDSYSCYCELDHVFVDSSDIAGVVILSNTEQYAECQSCQMDIPSGVQNSTMLKHYVTDLIDGILHKNKFVSWGSYDDLIQEGNPDVPGSGGESGGGDNPDAPDGPIPSFKDKAYKYIRFDKMNTLYTFYASTDGIMWIEVGNTSFVDAGRIGFFVYGTDDINVIENGKFVVKSFYLFRNKYLTLTGITDKSFEIRSNGKVIADDTSSWVNRKDDKVIIDMTNQIIPLNGQINLFEDEALMYSKELIDVFGGDLFNYTYKIRVSFNNQEIDQNKIFNLGTFIDFKQTFRIVIYNEEDYALKNLPVTLLAYSEYYSGQEPIKIALYDENNVQAIFKKDLIIDEIQPTEGRSILVGLNDSGLQNFYTNANSYRFKLNIG